MRGPTTYIIPIPPPVTKPPVTFTFIIKAPDSFEELKAVVTRCHSCHSAPKDFVLTCVGCLRYHSRQLHFCLLCADRFQLVAAHQCIHGGDHLIHRARLTRAVNYACGNCDDDLRGETSFTCPACSYSSGFHLCLSCAFNERKVKVIHDHSAEFVEVIRGVILSSLGGLVEGLYAATCSTKCSGCRWNIVGPVFRCRDWRSGKCHYALCSECIDSGRVNYISRVGDHRHAFKVEYGNGSPSPHATGKIRSKEPASSSLVPLLQHHRLSFSPQAHIIAELQARFSKLRFSRNNAIVGIFASVGLAVVTHGTSLFGLLFSGPKFFYYSWKLEKLRVLMKQNGVPIPKRRIVELVAPLLLGTVVAGFGLGLDAIVGLGAAVLSPSNFLSGVGSDAANAVKDLATASGTPPSEAFEVALSSVVHALGSYSGGGTGPDALVQHMRHGNKRLYDLADSVQHGDVVEQGRINIAEEGLQECVSKSLEGVTWNVIGPLGQPESKSSKWGLPVNISRLLRDRRKVQQRSFGKTIDRQLQLSSSTTPGTHIHNSSWLLVPSPSRARKESRPPTSFEQSTRVG